MKICNIKKILGSQRIEYDSKTGKNVARTPASIVIFREEFRPPPFHLLLAQCHPHL